jgi:YbbR domain-containing protein
MKKVILSLFAIGLFASTNMANATNETETEMPWFCYTVSESTQTIQGVNVTTTVQNCVYLSF